MLTGKKTYPEQSYYNFLSFNLKKQNKKHYSPKEKHSTLHFSFTLTYNVEKSITNMELSEQI